MVKTTPRRSVWKDMEPEKDVLRELPQVPNTKSVRRDASRKARLPGLRISRTGKKYWESRSNRSDKKGSNL